jgi:hypothetical protein
MHSIYGYYFVAHSAVVQILGLGYTNPAYK